MEASVVKDVSPVVVYHTSYNLLLRMGACYEGNVEGESPYALLFKALDEGNPVLVIDQSKGAVVERSVRPELADRIVNSRVLFAEVRRQEKMPIAWLASVLKGKPPGLSLGTDHANDSTPHHLLPRAAE